jgi:hypothetical protein
VHDQVIFNSLSLQDPPHPSRLARLCTQSWSYEWSTCICCHLWWCP